MFPKNRILEVASEVSKEHLAFCRVKIQVGREREKKKGQMKPEGNKAVIMEMRELPRQETRIEKNKSPLREICRG